MPIMSSQVLLPPRKPATINVEKIERFMTVLKFPEPANRPWIKICGRWLSRVGFVPGARVSVRVSKGRLVITLLPDPLQEVVVKRRRRP
jgi:hypothetical protein